MGCEGTEWELETSVRCVKCRNKCQVPQQVTSVRCVKCWRRRCDVSSATTSDKVQTTSSANESS